MRRVGLLGGDAMPGMYSLSRSPLPGGRTTRHAARGLLLPALVLLAASPAAAFEAGALARIDSLRLAYQADSALAVIDQMLPTAASSADSALFLALWVRQGELLTSLGQARAGERVLRRTLASARSQGDSATACAALRWLSVAVASQGRAADAADLNHELLALARRLGNRRNEGWALVGLAWDEAMRGRPDAAVQHYRGAIALFRATADGRAEAWARNGLGTALDQAGRSEEARQSYLAAAALAREARHPLVACFAANNLGALEYSRGDPGEALEHFREAARLDRSLGSIRESIIPGINIALCETDLGRLDAAADSLAGMLALCRREGFVDLEARVLNQLGDTRVFQGHRSEARACYRSVLRLGEQAPFRSRTEAVIGLARSFADPDSSAAAALLVEEALRALDPAGEPELRIQLEMSLGRLRAEHEPGAQALAPLRRAERAAQRLGLTHYGPEALSGMGRAYLALGLRDSARVAFERAAELWEAHRGLPADPEWREVRGASGRLIGAQLVGLILGDPPAPDEIREAYERAQAFKARTLLERMSGPVTSAGDLDPSLSLPDLQAVLLEGELLLDYFLGPARSYLFAVTRDSCRLAVLPSEEILEPAARLYHDLLAAPPTRASDEAALREAAGRLGPRLLAGITDAVCAHRRILVISDGALSLLPFEQLLPASPADVEWVRVPSAAILARIRSSRRQDPDPARARMLVLADATGPTGRLRGIGTEVSDLVGRYGGVDLRMLTGVDSLRVEDLAGPWTVLHVACHSEVDDQRPWLSALHLGRGGLRAGTIARARLSARLACLSSCRTAHGRVLSGEGVLGLSTALLAAGTECVVATLWPVEDRATARLVGTFYAELAAGRSVAGALQRAKQALREDPATSHPFFWAGFVTIGAGETRIPLGGRALPPVVRAAAIASLAVPAGVGLVIWWRRIRRQRRVIRDGNEHLKG